MQKDLILTNITSEFDQLDNKCSRLLSAILTTTEHADKMKLKREYHQTKLEMIDILDTEQIHKGQTARQLIDFVDSTPPVPRYLLGFPELDKKFYGGIEVGTLIQLGGQSFAGKTHLVLEILSNVVAAYGAVFFNFEMGDKRISRKLKKILTTDRQMDNLIIDSRTRDIDMLLNEIRIYAKKGIKFFAIDSKMKITSSENDDFKRFNEISSKLARVAQENDIIVFLINQMSEADIKDGRFSFKGSGDQLYDTDIALFYTVDKKNDQRRLTCPKNRQNEVEFSLFVDLDKSSNTLSFRSGDKIEFEVIEYEDDNRYGDVE